MLLQHQSHQEIELWSHLNADNIWHCPASDTCLIKGNGNKCAEEDLHFIASLRGERRTSDDFSLVQDFCLGGVDGLVKILAGDFLEKAKVSRPPIQEEIVALADDVRQIEVRQVPLKNYHGATWYLGKEWVIHLNSNDTLARRRFTLFHEVFHILYYSRNRTCPSSTGIVENNLFHEVLADIFSASVLMPEKWLNENWPTICNVEKLAETCGVPPSAAIATLLGQGLPLPDENTSF